MIEPRNHQEAMSRPEASEWILSENRELNALERLQWAIEVDIPEGAHLLGCKWAYRYKTNIDGTVNSTKAESSSEAITPSRAFIMVSNGWYDHIDQTICFV
jgi:hypothetical protein